MNILAKRFKIEMNKNEKFVKNKDQIIYFNAVGMGIEDIAIVSHAYSLAKEKGLGINLNYWE